MRKKKPAQLFVDVGGVPVPVPERWPIGGDTYKTVLFDVIPEPLASDEEQAVTFARIVFATNEFHLLKRYENMWSFYAALHHEFTEGVNSNCDLGLTHAQISTLGQFGPSFWLTFVMAQ